MPEIRKVNCNVRIQKCSSGSKNNSVRNPSNGSYTGNTRNIDKINKTNDLSNMKKCAENETGHIRLVTIWTAMATFVLLVSTL